MKSTNQKRATMSAHPATTLDLEAIEALLASAANASPGEFDEDYITFTDEPISHFEAARMSYNEAGSIIKQTDTSLHVTDVQVRKGDTRKDLTIVDLGDVRAVVTY